MGSPTSFTLESQLAPPITGWLEASGYRVRSEVPILGRRADLVGVRDDVVAVELKLRDWSEALRQAIAYQLAADRAWIAMPLATASAVYRHRWELEAEGVGLLVVDEAGRVRTPVEPRPSPRLLPFLRERTLAGPARPAEASIPFDRFLGESEASTEAPSVRQGVLRDPGEP